MSRFIMDIETTGLKSIAKNEYINERGEKIRNVKVNKIICISILNLETNNLISFYGADESKILQQFWTATKSCVELINFNIYFDIEFILIKSLLNNIPINKNFKNIKITDLRRIIYPYNQFGTGKLRDFCDFLLIKYNTPNGSKMLDLYNKKEWKKIKQHCEEDCRIVKELYGKLKQLNFI